MRVATAASYGVGQRRLRAATCGGLDGRLIACRVASEACFEPIVQNAARRSYSWRPHKAAIDRGPNGPYRTFIDSPRAALRRHRSGHSPRVHDLSSSQLTVRGTELPWPLSIRTAAMHALRQQQTTAGGKRSFAAGAKRLVCRLRIGCCQLGDARLLDVSNKQSKELKFKF